MLGRRPLLAAVAGIDAMFNIMAARPSVVHQQLLACAATRNIASNGSGNVAPNSISANPQQQPDYITHDGALPVDPPPLRPQDNPELWSTTDVVQWLGAHGFAEYVLAMIRLKCIIKSLKTQYITVENLPFFFSYKGVKRSSFVAIYIFSTALVPRTLSMVLATCFNFAVDRDELLY